MKTLLATKSCMKIALRTVLVIGLCATAIAALAETRVFELTNPNTESVLQLLRSTFGDKVRADLFQGKLVVVGTPTQLDEISTLLTKIDRAPTPLHLTLRERLPPSSEQNGTIVYSSGDDGYTVDTVESAFVTIDYQKIAQQPVANGWLIAIDNVPQKISSLLLQIQLLNNRSAQILVSYSKQENQDRRVFGNTLVGEIGAWIPLLPQPSAPPPGTINTGRKPGQQLYLRIEKKSAR